MRVFRKEFEKLAEAALADVPEKFRKLLFNLEIEVKLRPGREARKFRKTSNLLGLYVGAPRAEMVSPFSPAYPPSRIILYQRNIEAISSSRRELMHQVVITLRHELAHHFGFTDAQLEKVWPFH